MNSIDINKMPFARSIGALYDHFENENELVVCEYGFKFGFKNIFIDDFLEPNHSLERISCGTARTIIEEIRNE